MAIPYSKIKERKESDPEYSARLRSYSKKYKENNLDKERERQRNLQAKKREQNRDAYNAYMREWTEKNKDRLNAERRAKRASDPEIAIKDNQRRREKRDPIKHRNTMLKVNYGITLDDYNKLYELQNGKCAICGEEKPDNGKNGLVVDHCHRKGNIRGLLCTNCNNGLGRFKDKISSLEAAIVYLQNDIKE